jgi:hypothetical protein
MFRIRWKVGWEGGIWKGGRSGREGGVEKRSRRTRNFKCIEGKSYQFRSDLNANCKELETAKT